VTLSPCQKAALKLLESDQNVFLTGVPGSGKSHLIRHYREKNLLADVLASTGAAAIQLGGRTFHGYFGLGIGQGGPKLTIERALQNSRLLRRLKKAKTVIIDEVSMLSGVALNTANAICKQVRESTRPWGGIRVIAVGDFAQLPPVNQYDSAKDWAFLCGTWQESGFVPALLRSVLRTDDPKLLSVLGNIRKGIVNQEVAEFLNERSIPISADFMGPRIFPRRNQVEEHNLKQLNDLGGKVVSFETKYKGVPAYLENAAKNAPIPAILHLKENALVMLRQNDPAGRWVNGSLGTILKITPEKLRIALHSGEEVDVEPTTFTVLDAEDTEVASATNFPVNLAYATTIHKAQGLTLDCAQMDLRMLWEPGQAYVALSRVKNSQGIFVAGWSPSSIRVAAEVLEFDRELEVDSLPPPPEKKVRVRKKKGILETLMGK